MNMFFAVLTTFDDFRRWSLPGRNGFWDVISFDIKGLQAFWQRNEGLLVAR